jgi:hypothetical protein
MENLYNNPLAVKFMQTALLDWSMQQANLDVDYLNNCSIDEFVNISEMIRNETEFNSKIIKCIVYNMIYRDDLKFVSNLLLCNIAYCLDKFDQEDYKCQEFMIETLVSDVKKEEKKFNQILLKYVIELLKTNLNKYKPDVRYNVLDIII